jgi:hypothetical protein
MSDYCKNCAIYIAPAAEDRRVVKQGGAFLGVVHDGECANVYQQTHVNNKGLTIEPRRMKTVTFMPFATA